MTPQEFLDKWESVVEKQKELCEWERNHSKDKKVSPVLEAGLEGLMKMLPDFRDTFNFKHPYQR